MTRLPAQQDASAGAASEVQAFVDTLLSSSRNRFLQVQSNERAESLKHDD